MRQISFSILGIALLMSAACAKVEEPAVDQPVPAESADFQIMATIDNNSIDTKTAYTEDATAKKAVITWVKDDKINLLAYASADPYSANCYPCDIDESTINGDQATFKASGAISTDYPLSYYAVYPADLTISGTKDNYNITLPAEYTVSGTDFTQVKVPLIGTVDSGNEYVFTTATGVLKITLSNVPVNARKVVLITSSDKLSGVFPLDAANGLQMSECTSPGNSITVNFPQQAAGSTISVYMPVPVGTISAGATFQVQDGSGNAIKVTAATKKAISIVKGHLLPLPTISVEDWVSLGTGKFVDNHTFYQAAGWCGANGLTANTYFDVEIQQHKTEANRYRLVNPYGPMFDTYGATKFGTGPNDYLTFTVRNDLGTDVIINDSFRTGIDQYGPSYYDEKELWYDNPYWGYTPLYQNNRIINKDSEGKILNIQLAPYYMGGADEDCSQNPKIEIVFPGATPMLADCFNYANGASAAYSADDAIVNVTIANSLITGVKVKAANSISAGVEALLSGDADLTFTESGSKELTGLAVGGDYYLIYKVETNGHGYTFKNAGNIHYVDLPPIALSSSMLTVSTDATYNGGTTYDGNGYASLVDGKLSTYWHTAYDSQAGDDYDWANLDSVYGAYIDIALDSALKTFRLEYTTRPDGDNSSPRAIIFAVSNDRTTWNQVQTVEEDYMNVGRGQTIILPKLVATDAFTYLRVGIIKSGPTPSILTDSKGGSTAIAEIKLYGKNN